MSTNISKPHKQENIFYCYIPQLLKNLLKEENSTQKLIERPVLIENLMEFADRLNLEQGNQSIFFLRRMLINLITEAVNLSNAITHIYMSYLSYESKNGEVFPFFGNSNSPILIVPDTTELDVDDYSCLGEYRKKIDFNIIDSKTFSKNLYKEFMEEREVFESFPS